MDTATNVMLSASNASSGSLGERLGLSKTIGASTKNAGSFGWWVFAFILFVLSLLFLVGPSAHMSQAFDKEHNIATIVILLTQFLFMIMSFFTFGAKKGLLIFDTIVLMLAGLYYLLSFIPFARSLLGFMYRGNSGSTVVSGLNAAV